MSRASFALIAFALLSACVQPEVTSFRAPNGASVSTARCTKTADACFAKATQTCGGGTYQVVDSYSNAGGLVADVMAGPVTWYTMRFQCGRSDGRLPTFPFRGQEYTPAPVIYTKSPSYASSSMSCRSNTVGNYVYTNCD